MSLSASAQSDDGWFTGKLSAFCVSGNHTTDLSIDYCHYYNLENHHSLGMGTGIVFHDNPTISVPITAQYRLRILGHRNIMPTATLSGGYMINSKEVSNGGIFQAKAGIETGYLSRIRYSIDVGYQITSGINSIMIGAGILF